MTWGRAIWPKHIARSSALFRLYSKRWFEEIIDRREEAAEKAALRGTQTEMWRVFP